MTIYRWMDVEYTPHRGITVSRRVAAELLASGRGNLYLSD